MIYHRAKLNQLLIYVFFIWTVIFIVLIAGCDIKSSKEWDSVTKKIRSKYPTVSHLSTEEVHTLLARQDHVKPVLLDVREPDEYAVSHLRGAHLAPTEKEALKIIARQDRDSMVIVYCSVGYRSSEMSKKLQENGLTNVFNLEGSIFKWANEGRELYQGNRRVSVVHPFNSKWRQLLDKRLWSQPVD